MRLFQPPSPRKGILLAVAGCTALFSWWVWWTAGSTVGIRPQTAIWLACAAIAFGVRPYWGLVLLVSHPATWIWSYAFATARDDLRAGRIAFYLVEGTRRGIDPATRLFFQDDRLPPSCSGTDLAVEEARTYAAWMTVYVGGPVPGSYRGALYSEAEAVALASTAAPVALTQSSVAALFADPTAALARWQPAEAWHLRGGARVPLAAVAIGDDGLILSWNDGERIALYDRHTAVLVDEWEPGRDHAEVLASSLFGQQILPGPFVAGRITINRRVSGHEDRDNAVWLRRRWLHEPRSTEEIEALLRRLAAHEITTIYPFIGPMGQQPTRARFGRFGWRDGDAVREYDPETARAFFIRAHAAAGPRPLHVLPWTGGVLYRDVFLDDPTWRAAFVKQAMDLVALGADGIHLNIEPMPEDRLGTDYLALLAELRAGFAAAGKPNALISVAAYPPRTELHPFPDVHWSDGFLTQVCHASDDVSVMAYDTALPDASSYSGLVATWAGELSTALTDCTWRMGVPDYDDDEPWHRPAAETLAAALDGLAAAPHPSGGHPPDGVAIYASWTTDSQEWALFDTKARLEGPQNTDPIDP